MFDQQSSNVSADRGGIAAGRDVNIGVPPEVLIALIQQQQGYSETQKKLISELETKLDLTQGQIQVAFDILGEGKVPPERLGTKLVEIAEQFKVLRSLALVQPGDDPRIVSLRADALKAIEDGDLNKADSRLAEAETEQRRALDRLSINVAETSAQRGEIALTRLRYSEAASHFANAAALLAPGSAHEDKRISYIGWEADALYRQGDEFGDNEALLVAIERYKHLIVLNPRARLPLDWAAIQNNLGGALMILGERDSGTARLEEAVSACRASLEERTRARAPLDWAMTQSNLGSALMILGERDSGTARLEEAVTAYRAALEERTRTRAPLQWAMTQNNLGNALRTLGERESGTARLEEAVTAYRSALEEWTRARVPLDWAMTQNNLGTALTRLGERESGTARLEEAVTAYRAALEEWTRARVPLAWAMTQNNLGAALWRLGERENRTARLEEAVTAYRAALEERTRERVPYLWAQTQENLALAYKRIFDSNRDPAYLDRGLEAVDSALDEYKRAEAAFDIMTATSLRTAILAAKDKL